MNAVTWITENLDRPWLIAGKGPSLSKRAMLPLEGFHVLALNHACQLLRSKLAHFTDLEAFLQCQDHLQTHAVCMPWHPHLQMRPGKKSLLELTKLHPALDRLNKEDRLLSYNSTLALKLPLQPGLPLVRVRHFSAVPAFNLLLAAGCKTVRSLGIDGGTGYAEGLDMSHHLANGRTSFDAQFQEIEFSLKQYGARWEPCNKLKR